MADEVFEAKPYLVKLVRDAVATKLVTDTITYEPIPDPEEAIRLLRAKLIEEAVEYALDPSLHELADVLEVVQALAWHDLDRTPMSSVDSEAKRKRESRGGFHGLTGMYAQTSAGKWSDAR